MAAAIQTEQLSKTYSVGFPVRKKVLALQGLDLKVEEGEIYGLLGPNGAGKSTTIKLTLNLIRPTSGSVKVFGLDPSEPKARAQIGFLPENPAPYEYLTGVEFVTLAAQLVGVPSGELKSRVSEVVEKVGMGTAAALQIRRYSKGMIQRISLAQALVGRPKLLILDEPTSGLDVLGRQLIRDVIVEERKKGTAVLFCSHIIPDVEALCDRVALVIGGKNIRTGTVSSLIESDSNQVELVIDGAVAALDEKLRPHVKQLDRLSERVVVRCEESATNTVLKVLLEANARVVKLQRTKFTLEELFIKAVKESGQAVGSSMS
ncbi:MAG: ABC transporter ATP-binding protein [Archangium sp.]|nr:ABC transporter ATP-binding protein [Archangium sp.]